MTTTKTVSTAKGITTIKAAAVAFAKAEVLAGDAVEFVARTMGSKPTYAHWESVRKDFVTAYMIARKCADAAAAEAWRRLTDRLSTSYALTKPKAPNADAKRSTAARDAKKKQVDALIGKHKTVEALVEASRTAAPAELKTFADAIAKADKANENTAKAKARKLADTLKARVGKMPLEQLEALAICADMIAAGKKVTFAK